MLKSSKIKGVVWDDGNLFKNWLKHDVSPRECEEIFFDFKNKIIKDPLHSNNEERYVILGKTFKGRVLYVVFTVRKNLIRIISARDLKKKKELKLYEK